MTVSMWAIEISKWLIIIGTGFILGLAIKSKKAMDKINKVKKSEYVTVGKNMIYVEKVGKECR